KAAGSPKSPQNVVCIANVQGGTTAIAGLTREVDAVRFPYSFNFGNILDLSGTIRNSAQVKIANHSGVQTDGPNPKFTYAAGPPPPCVREQCGCTYTQGHWGSKPDVVWPGLSHDDLFFASGLTYQEIMDVSVARGNAYINLAHQYIAAVL